LEPGQGHICRGPARVLLALFPEQGQQEAKLASGPVLEPRLEPVLAFSLQVFAQVEQVEFELEAEVEELEAGLELSVELELEAGLELSVELELEAGLELSVELEPEAGLEL
jgi:hypothetical protein